MTLVIAEAGVNHNGSEELAFQLVDLASNAGADVVKFQTFIAKNLATKTAQKARYQIKNTGITESQFEMLSRLELSFDSHYRLASYCNKKNIEFLSTAFDIESLNFLSKEIGMRRLKIPSGEITNAPLVLEHARTQSDIILSTGMSTLSEIESALGVIAFGYIAKNYDIPSTDAFRCAFLSNEGKDALKEKVTILHCTSDYPASLNDINLKAMDTIADTFGLNVGYSDHSLGTIVPIVAVARGAKIIEKHFTLDREMDGPDHKASLNPIELRTMIEGIRDAELCLGDGIKCPTSSELENALISRKSIVANSVIKVGERFTSSNIAIKRPGNGLSPFDYWRILNKPSKKHYFAGDCIDIDE